MRCSFPAPGLFLFDCAIFPQPYYSLCDQCGILALEDKTGAAVTDNRAASACPATAMIFPEAFRLIAACSEGSEYSPSNEGRVFFRNAIKPKLGRFSVEIEPKRCRARRKSLVSA
jgi:hypothetical protein